MILQRPCECSAAILACSLLHGIHLVYRETYLEDPSAPNKPTAASPGNARSLTGTLCEPVSLNIGRSVANGEESERRTQHFAIPTPRFARKFSTWNPQKCMVAQPRNQVSEMHFNKCPDPSTLQCWKTRWVCACSNSPTEALLWMKDVEMVASVDDVGSSQSIGGRIFPNSEMLDAKDCVRLEEGHHESTLPEESQSVWRSKRPKWKTDFLWKTDAFMICEHFRATGAHEAVLDYSDLFRITLHGDDVQDFDTIWDRSFIINQ